MSQPSPDCPTFEEALENLEAIVHELEEGQIGLAEALARYEQGVKLLKQCFNLLEGAERKIELLSGFDAAGNPVTGAVRRRIEPGSRRKRRSTLAPARGGTKPKPATADEDAANVDSPRNLF